MKKRKILSFFFGSIMLILGLQQLISANDTTINYFLINKTNTPATNPDNNDFADPDVFLSMYVGNGVVNSNAEQYSNTLIWSHNNQVAANQFTDGTENDYVSDSMLNRLHGASMSKEDKVIIPSRYNQIRDDIMISARAKELLTEGALNSVTKPYLKFSLSDDSGAVVFNGSKKLSDDTGISGLNESWDTRQFFDGMIALHETEYVQTKDTQWDWATGGAYIGEWQKRLHQWNDDQSWDTNAQELIDIYNVNTSNINASSPVSQVKAGSSASGFKSRYGFKWFNPHSGANSAGNLTMATEWHAAFNFNYDGNNNNTQVGSYDGYGAKELGVIGMFNGIMDSGLSNLGGFPTKLSGGMGAQLAMRGFYRNGADIAATATNSFIFDPASYTLDDSTRKKDATYNIYVNADVVQSSDKTTSLTKTPIDFTLATTRPYFQGGNETAVDYVAGSQTEFNNQIKIDLYDDGVLESADSSGNAQKIAVVENRVKIYVSSAAAPDWSAVIAQGNSYNYQTLKNYLNSLAPNTEISLLYTYMATDAKTDTWTPSLGDDQGAYAIPLVKKVKMAQALQPISVSLVALKNTTGKAMDANQFEFKLYNSNENATKGNLIDVINNDLAGYTSPVKLNTISFKTEGTYYYYLEETSEAGNGWSVDGTKYLFKITVLKNNSNQLTATIRYTSNASKNCLEESAWRDYKINDKATFPVFTNNYKVVPVDKTTSLSSIPKAGTDKIFVFVIMITSLVTIVFIKSNILKASKNK